MPAPSPRTKPPRVASKGRQADLRIVVEGGEGGEAVEAGDAEGVDHGVGAAGDHDINIAAADEFGGFADGLGRCGAGGEAVEGGAAGVEFHRQVCNRHGGFLFDFGHGVENFQRQFPPDFGVEDGRPFAPGGQRGAGEIDEIQAALAGTGVGADVIRIEGEVLSAEP